MCAAPGVWLSTKHYCDDSAFSEKKFTFFLGLMSSKWVSEVVIESSKVKYSPYLRKHHYRKVWISPYAWRHWTRFSVSTTWSNLLLCFFFISSTFSFFSGTSSNYPLSTLSHFWPPASWSLTPAQMVFPKINHGFLSADQQLIKRRLIKVVLDLTLLSQ